jgi:hypothetical protein
MLVGMYSGVVKKVDCGIPIQMWLYVMAIIVAAHVVSKLVGILALRVS